MTKRRGFAWPAGLLVVVVVGIAVAVGVSNQKAQPQEPPSPSTQVAALPSASPTPSRTQVPATTIPTATPAPSPIPIPTPTRNPGPIPTPRTPEPSRPPEPTPTPDPLASPTGLQWDVALPKLKGTQHYLEPIAWSGGFAALDDRIQSQARLWLSPDGHHWTRYRLPFWPTVFGTQVVAFHDGLVLARISQVGITGFRFEVWMSGDGKTWQQRGSIATAAETPGYVASGELVALGDRLAVYGYIGPYNSGGVHPASTAATAAQSELGQWVWTSADGRSWRRQRVQGVGTDGVGISGWTDQGFVGIRGNGSRGWLVRSPDGIHWKTIAPLPAKVDLDSPAELVATASGYVLAADTLERGECCQLTVWHVSRSGVFTQILEQFHWEANGLAADGATVVVTSYEYHGLEARTDPLALVSRDGGKSFALSAGWPALQGTDCLREVAVNHGTVVAAGGCDVTSGPALLVTDVMP